MGSSTYTLEAFINVCALLKVTFLRKEKLPSSPGDHPGLYLSPLLGEEQHSLHQHLVGMAEWLVQIGSFDISFAVNSLNRFYVAPREGHIKQLVNIFGHFQDAIRKQKSIVISPEDISEISGKVANTVYWLDKYPDAAEGVDEGLPDTRGWGVSP